MKDHLLDIVAHTQKLSIGIDLAKIIGTDSETTLETSTEDRSLVLNAKFNGVISEFIGRFGMPNLSKLSTILNIPEYQEDAVITMIVDEKDGTKTPTGIHFENKTGDFKNDYRLMSAGVIDQRMQSLRFKGAKWHVDVVPSVTSIQKLRFQAQANSEETTFIAKTENGDLKFYFGDHSSHAGNFVFESHVSGKLSRALSWPVAPILAVLSLSGDKTLKFSDDGAAMITVDSGIAQYNYIFLSQSK